MATASEATIVWSSSDLPDPVVPATRPCGPSRRRSTANGPSVPAPMTTAVDGPAACREPGRGAFVPYEKLLTSQRWNPRYLQDLAGFRALRFLDWSRTNDSKLVSWRDRPRVESPAWSGEHGVPVVPRGAGTGLAGGANTGAGELSIDVSGMRRILEVSAADQLAVVEPVVTVPVGLALGVAS